MKCSIGKGLKRIFQISLLCSLLQQNCSFADQPPKKKVIVCTQSERTTFFWDSLYGGIEAAAKDMNAQVVFLGAYDPEVSHLPSYISKAVSQKPDGLIVSIPNPDLLKQPIYDALAHHIPIVAVDSGYNDFRELGIKTFVGENPYETGVMIAKKLVERGVTKLLCVRSSDEDSSTDLSIQGIKTVFVDPQAIQIISIREVSPSTGSAMIGSKLIIDPSFNGVLSMDATVALPTIYALQERQLYGKIFFATFDISHHIAEGLKEKKIAFAVSKQPYMQGYLALAIAISSPDINLRVLFDQLNKRTQYNFFPPGSIPYKSYEQPGDVIYSGPIFITPETVAKTYELNGGSSHKIAQLDEEGGGG